MKQRGAGRALAVSSLSARTPCSVQAGLTGFAPFPKDNPRLSMIAPPGPAIPLSNIYLWKVPAFFLCSIR